LARTADARRSQGRYSDASRLYRRALTLAEDVFGPRNRELAPILSGLASAEQAQGHEEDAEQLTRRAASLSDESATGPPGAATAGESD
jgi:hypothetical protein